MTYPIFLTGTALAITVLGIWSYAIAAGLLLGCFIILGAWAMK